ncbi:MAG TPA: enoyl-CoA hydratase/isomerase family protein [Pyrinomonadaceae bacterium]|nr:enoyl-CoA hydratase/isomerase family protein [Pyrinomonadaceae bacterium]
MTEQAPDVEKRAVIVEARSSCAIVRINRAAFRNSLSVATLEELDATVSALIKQEDTSAIVFTGTGDVFASGADIRELQTLPHDTAKEFAGRGQQLFQKIADARQLTIAAINGYCMGGGLDLALACDLRCASPTATFAHPGARLGIITGWGGTQRLPGLIGTARAFEMFATARRVECREAYEIGLISRIGEPVLDCGVEMAMALGTKAQIIS